MGATSDVLTPIAGYNSFPTGFVTVGWERVWLGLAICGVGLVFGRLLYRSAWAAWTIIVSLIGWVALGFTQFPGNMIGSDAIIVTDSAPGGMGIYKLSQKAVPGIRVQSGNEEGFMVSNVRRLSVAGGAVVQS